jgi:hypothetical protein
LAVGSQPERAFLLASSEIKTQYSGPVTFQPRKLFLSALAVGGAFLAFFPSASGSGVVSDATQDALQTCMNGGGTVTFAINGTIYLTNAIVVANNTLLDATGHNVAISGSNLVQIFVVHSNTTLTITNLTFENGFIQSSDANIGSAGGAISNAGSMAVTSCLFVGNGALGVTGVSGAYGGAVYNGGTFTSINCVFSNNSATGGDGSTNQGGDSSLAGWPAAGGAVFSSGQTAFVNCTFSSNTSAGGVGTLIPLIRLPGTAGGAGGSADGGALCNNGSLVASNNVFARNFAIGGTAGPGVGGQVGPRSNIAPGIGGQGGAANGGGMAGLGGTASLVNDTFCSNGAVGGAGGTGGFGGGFQSVAQNGGQGGNGGNGNGGGFAATGGSALAWNITVASNAAAGGTRGAGGAGGEGNPGIFGSAGPPGQPGDGKGDSLGNSGGTITLKNSIFCPSNSTDTNIYGSAIDAGNNIDSSRRISLTNPTSLQGVNPHLASLQNNGGPTLTMALLAGSPAVAAADPADSPATDQRGVLRPTDHAPDIGAFEATNLFRISGQIEGLMPNVFASISADSQSVLTTSNGAYSLVVDNANYSISPSNSDYVFVPPLQLIGPASSQSAANFQAYRMDTMTLLPGMTNSISFAVVGTNGQQFTVESSSNLWMWTPAFTSVIPAGGYTNVSFPMTGSMFQFFRLAFP